jgi:helix-turn-helix protein
MIDVPSSIEEVLALPSVGMLDRDCLPSLPGLYFAVLDGERVAYVGIARTSLRRRWAYHHRAIDLMASGKPTVHYMTAPAGSSLKDAEDAAIRAFVPSLNRVHPWPLATAEPHHGGELLTIPMAAAELDITRATLWKHIRAGKLEGAQQLGGAGGTWVIERQALEAFKAANPRRTRKTGHPRRAPPPA